MTEHRGHANESGLRDRGAAAECGEDGMLGRGIVRTPFWFGPADGGTEIAG
jgi:hypothetical protein